MKKPSRILVWSLMWMPVLMGVSFAGTFTFTPSDDASCRGDSLQSNNYGDTSWLFTRNNPTATWESFLKFGVSGLTGSVQSATLRLYVQDNSNPNAVLYAVGDVAWSEDTIHWNNRPALGSQLSSVSGFGSGVWLELNVTSVVTGNGTFAFGLSESNSPTPKLQFSSKEGTNPPELVVVTGFAPPPAAEGAWARHALGGGGGAN